MSRNLKSNLGSENIKQIQLNLKNQITIFLLSWWYNFFQIIGKDHHFQTNEIYHQILGTKN